MDKRDEIQQEAIRKLARISATRSGGFRVDPAAEQAEKDRISRLVDPKYKSHPAEADDQNASPTGSIFQIVKFAILIAILAYIGLSF
jgi:hypothetical protein